MVSVHNEQLHDLHSSPSIVRVIISGTMRWEWHVVRRGEARGGLWFWWGNLRERDHWGDPGVDGKIILEWIFRKWDVGYGLDWTGSG
jgi:hypothetical protein